MADIFDPSLDNVEVEVPHNRIKRNEEVNLTAWDPSMKNLLIGVGWEAVSGDAKDAKGRKGEARKGEQCWHGLFAWDSSFDGSINARFSLRPLRPFASFAFNHFRWIRSVDDGLHRVRCSPMYARKRVHRVIAGKLRR